MRKFFIILSHTYFTRLKSKSFIISTAVILLFLTGIANLDRIIQFFINDEEKEVIVIDHVGDLYPWLEENETIRNESIQLRLYEASEADGKQAVEKGEYDGLLVLDPDESRYMKATYYENDAVESWEQMALEEQLQQLKIALATEDSGIDEESLQLIYQPISFEKISLDQTAKTDEELNAARGIVYVMLFVLYLAVIIYGQMIATDVATEKSSRVMEILISSASPLTHMFAKIIGIAFLGMTQIAIVFLYSFSLFRANENDFTGSLLQEFGFSSSHLSLYIYAFVFFILGYFLYATIAAMLGSLVSRVEDVQQLTQPLIYLVMIAFFIAIFGLGAPDAKFITITSFIPFFTPMIMFLRIGMLDVATWEIALSIFILVFTILFFSLLSARIYKGGVLMYGPSRSLKDFRQAFLMTKKD